MDENLKEALETIKDLRASLQLAHFERGEMDDAQVNKSLDDAEAVLLKHGEYDDMMVRPD